MNFEEILTFEEIPNDLNIVNILLIFKKGNKDNRVQISIEQLVGILLDIKSIIKKAISEYLAI